MHRIARWALLVSLSLAFTAHAEDRSASWLLERLSVRAHDEGTRAQKSGRADDAKTWQSWSEIYGRAAQNHGLAEMSAEEMARRDEVFCKEQLAKTTGRGQALYRSSIPFWQEIARQVHAGKEPTAPFPKEMLVPVPGLAGTPWENAVAPMSADECRALESQILTCENQLTLLMKQNALSGNQNGFLVAMRQHECNALLERHQACPK